MGLYSWRDSSRSYVIPDLLISPGCGDACRALCGLGEAVELCGRKPPSAPSTGSRVGRGGAAAG